MSPALASARLAKIARRFRCAALALLAAAAVAVPGQALAQTRSPARVRISVDTEGESTRIVLTLSRDVSHAVTRSGKRVSIVYSEPVIVEPSSGDVDDPILQSWKQDGENSISFKLGRKFEDLETFELKNPTRLIVDLIGRKPTPVETRPRTRAPAADRPIVVIDPGHGGVEKGAVGPLGIQEKDITLDLGIRLKRVMERSGVNVVLTRDNDRLVSLEERTAIANQNRATLFISIHLNSSRRRDAQGAETYFLSADASDDEARTLAALENEAYRSPDDGDGGPPPRVSGDAPAGGGNELELILWDLAQNQFLAESSRLAESVQREMNLLVGTRDRGVRQAPFTVLTGATMPAILVEVGFISNPEEEELLRSSSYRDRVVEALATAIDDFLSGRERIAGPASLTRPPAASGGATAGAAQQ